MNFYDPAYFPLGTLGSEYDPGFDNTVPLQLSTSASNSCPLEPTGALTAQLSFNYGNSWNHPAGSSAADRSQLVTWAPMTGYHESSQANFVNPPTVVHWAGVPPPHHGYH